MTAAMLETLNRIVGKGGYRSDQVNACRTPGLPTTMRELIECTWGDYEALTPSPPWIPDLTGLFWRPGCLQESAVPIDISVFRQNRCPAPERVIYPAQGVLGLKPLCETFWKWLLKNDPKHLPKIDHRLDDKLADWPLMRRFNKELHKIGYYDAEDLFGSDIIEESQTTCAWMPLYDICEDESDRVPLLLYLENAREIIGKKSPGGQAEFSETIFEYGFAGGLDTDRIRLCERVFIRILQARRWRLLPKLWAKACRALEAYSGNVLAFYDPDQVRVETDFKSGDPLWQMDVFFEILKEVHAVMEGTWELVKECETRPEPFWLSFLNHLQSVGKRHPELTAPPPPRVKIKAGV